MLGLFAEYADWPMIHEHLAKFVEVMLQEFVLKKLCQDHGRSVIEHRTCEEQRGRIGGREKDVIGWKDRSQAFEQFNTQCSRVERAMTEPNDLLSGKFR
jgi:hypothetical protein